MTVGRQERITAMWICVCGDSGELLDLGNIESQAPGVTAMQVREAPEALGGVHLEM